MFIPGLFVGQLFDLGYLKLPYFITSCLLLTCVFLTAECTQYWQFFLAQGLSGGVGSVLLSAVLTHNLESTACEWNLIWTSSGGYPSLVFEEEWVGSRGPCCRIVDWQDNFPYCRAKPHTTCRVSIECVLSACVVFNDVTFRFKWTVRVFGFILLVALGIGNIVS